AASIAVSRKSRCVRITPSTLFWKWAPGVVVAMCLAPGSCSSLRGARLIAPDHEAVKHHALHAAVVKLYGELGAVCGDNCAVSERLVEHPVTHSEARYFGAVLSRSRGRNPDGLAQLGAIQPSDEGDQSEDRNQRRDGPDKCAHPLGPRKLPSSI